MNKIVVVLFFFFFTSCLGKHSSDAQKATVSAKSAQAENYTGDTVPIDISKSKLHWKGTKMGGAGKHEGEIKLKDGYFITKDKQIVAGSLNVAMATLAVTDIPEYETIARKNLNEHLKSSEFFDVKKFPVSKFQLVNAKRLSPDSLLLSGNLSLKDITKKIKFRAKYKDTIFSTTFTIDRYQWNIAYTGSWTDRTFVDRHIEIKIALNTQ